MTSGGLVKELCEEASCSICLDFFRDPVTIPECGHNFCRDCLARSWGDLGAKDASCPHCRRKAQPNSLRPNHQLASFVQIARKFTVQEGKEAGGKKGVCKQHQEPLELFCKDEKTPLCVVCGRSKEHKDHQVVPLEDKAREKKRFEAARKEKVCQKHQKPLKLFCKDDEVLICVVCDRSKEHRNHETLPLEEASQEYKDQFRSCLKVMKKEREGILAFKGDVEKQSRDLFNQTTGGKQETVAKFRQLHLFLEEQEKLLLAQMEEVEKEVARKRDQRLDEVSEALFSLESLVQEMEEKCQQSARELLQDDPRDTLERYGEKETYEIPVTFPLSLRGRIWDVCDINHFLEGVMKQFTDTVDSGHLPRKDTLDYGHLPRKAKVILDPDTAHSKFILSEDLKSLTVGEGSQALPTNRQRFDVVRAVLGREGFRAGCHFWEVLVKCEQHWAVGVARESVTRKGKFSLSPEEGIWAVGKWWHRYEAFVKDHDRRLFLRTELKRIEVCLNYDEGRVAFFDADRVALIYEFSGARFSGETLLPFFWVYKKGHLKISS